MDGWGLIRGIGKLSYCAYRYNCNYLYNEYAHQSSFGLNTKRILQEIKRVK